MQSNSRRLSKRGGGCLRDCEVMLRLNEFSTQSSSSDAHRRCVRLDLFGNSLQFRYLFRVLDLQLSVDTDTLLRVCWVGRIEPKFSLQLTAPVKKSRDPLRPEAADAVESPAREIIGRLNPVGHKSSK